MTNRSTMIFAGATALFLASAVHSIATAQSPAPPAPWHAKNLKVLPADISRDQLIGTMKRFSQSLGVRCTFCHVGVEGKRETMDFPSDANPHKDVARAMMRMTMRLNEELPKIAGHADAKVTCFTCHRGSQEPVTDLPPPVPATAPPPPPAS